MYENVDIYVAVRMRVVIQHNNVLQKFNGVFVNAQRCSVIVQ